MTTNTVCTRRRIKVRSWRKRAAFNVVWMLTLLGLDAHGADGHYDQPRLWAMGLAGAGLVAWLTAYAVMSMLLGALE